MIYRLLILLGLALVGVAVWLTLAPRQTGTVTAQSSGPESKDQGYSATDASLIETGPDGLPMYTLQARQVQQEADSTVINLTPVQMTFRDSAGGQWQARADRAEAHQDTAQIDLSGAIQVSGTGAGNAQPARITTEKLQVDSRAGLIRTRSPVTLTWAGIVVEAHGLLVDTKESSVRLDSDVHGHFAR